LAILLEIVPSCSLMAWMPDKAISKLMARTFR
jgi:hypothetical protein